MKTVFIDGSAGTTGLRIRQRLKERSELQLIELPEESRKDPIARAEALNSADIVFLCLPDAAAKEAVGMITSKTVTVIDASTAHRVESGWAYGFPELSEEHMDRIRCSKRIAVPGCHASGFIALVYPLIKEGLLSSSARLSCFSLTGYSGGGKSMIAEYESNERDMALDAPRLYGLSQEHKHLREMKHVTTLETAPIFSPIVDDYYSGMLVTVPIFADMVKGGADAIKELYASKYTNEIVHYNPYLGEGGFTTANALSGKDSMELCVYGGQERLTLCARYDNLGKGASGAAVECMNYVLGVPAQTGLAL